MGKKRVGERSCMGCRRRAPKGELLRFVVGGNGDIHFDPRQRMHGRGGYLCPRANCFELASKKKCITVRFRQEVSFDPSLMLQRVREQLHRDVQETMMIGGSLQRERR